MGLARGLGRILAAPLLVFNLICAIIILAIAGRYLDRTISGDTNLSGYRSNGATIYLVLFSLIAGVVAIASYITALHHLRVWTSESGAASVAAAWIAWLLLIVAFCLAWKEIDLGGRGSKLKVLEAFVIILLITHLIYNMVLHIGDHGDHGDGGYRNRKPLNPNAPAAA
jgi:uncharacterized membrane protein